MGELQTSIFYYATGERVTDSEPQPGWYFCIAGDPPRGPFLTHSVARGEYDRAVEARRLYAGSLVPRMSQFIRDFCGRYGDGDDGLDLAMADGLDDLLVEARILRDELEG